MPNHVNCIGLFMVDWPSLNMVEKLTCEEVNIDKILEDEFLQLKNENLCSLAMPCEDIEARREYWGTSSGAYEVNATRLGGDCFPIVIDFKSSWRPPNAETMRAINNYLQERCFLINYLWIACDPFDDSVSDIPVLREVKSE